MEDQDKELEQKLHTCYIVYGICFGMPVGTLLGSMFGRIAAGTALGLLIGVIVGAYAEKRRKEKGEISMRDAEKTIGKIADKAKLVYLGYLEEEDGDPTPAIRAMLTPREREGIRVFYLTTNTSSQKAAAFRQNPKGCLYFVDSRFYRGVCLSGTVEVLEAPEAKARIWRDGDERYYPQGVTDPDYCVLKFTANRGRYYTNYKSENFTIPN